MAYLLTIWLVFIFGNIGLFVNYKQFRDSLKSGKINNLEKHITSLFNKTFSFYDFDENELEKSYHLVIGSILSLLDIGVVKSNREAGDGRYDLALLSNNLDDYSYICEIKKANSLSEVNNLLDIGIVQIKNMHYLNELINYKNKGIICFCFYKKM